MRDLQQEAEYLQNHWSNTPEWSQPGYEGFKDDRREWFAGKVLEMNPTSVLEVGCFGGYNLRHLNKIDPSVELIGVDINPSALEYAKQNLPSLKTVRSSIYALSQFESNSVDVVITAGVLIHIPNWDLTTDQEDTFLIQGIADQFARIARKGILHAEHHAANFSKMPMKGMRYIHNFRVLYSHHAVKVEEALNPSNGFEQLITVTLQ